MQLAYNTKSILNEDYFVRIPL